MSCSRLTTTLTLKQQAITLIRSNLTKLRWFHSLPFQQFQALLTLFSKSFSPFPHGTCLLSVSSQYLALEEDHLPLAHQFQSTRLLENQPYERTTNETGLSPSQALSSKKTCAGVYPGEGPRLQFAASCDLQCELIPVHSPLLRESCSFSFPPLTYMLKFSG